ncbi:hypothetical protein TGAMA5MH_05723 [Trichoderma gamsii]|uniref:Uncharacterized protein n=1 Tax=Trichoderma gamsii TaxID=398673 RepID=A0A2K0TBS1_9HYPO|nr:hypothetical protein TGAMA5MH_05723 [Trichoderma gamsii]
MSVPRISTGNPYHNAYRSGLRDGPICSVDLA